MLGRAAVVVPVFLAWLGVVQSARNPIVLLPGNLQLPSALMRTYMLLSG